jgi:hypothetical protein
VKYFIAEQSSAGEVQKVWMDQLTDAQEIEARTVEEDKEARGGSAAFSQRLRPHNTLPGDGVMCTLIRNDLIKEDRHLKIISKPQNRLGVCTNITELTWAER